VSSLRDLPQSIAPARDLWPQIEAEISAPRVGAIPGTAGRRRADFTGRRPWLAAAAMVSCVAIGVWIGRAALPGSAPATADRSAAPVPGSAAMLDAAYVSDPRYQREHAALMKSLQAQLATLPAPTRAKVTESLATIEHARQDLEQALGRDPSNALLEELLVNTYQDEMRVLTDVREASDAGKGI
jgi:uncharacterized SAM-binding protein YcdF (DUF218 family)